MKLKKNQFQRKEVCGNMGTYYDKSIVKMKGENLKYKPRLQTTNGDRVVRNMLSDDVVYNVEIHEWDDSEGFPYEAYVILDDLGVKTSV